MKYPLRFLSTLIAAALIFSGNLLFPSSALGATTTDAITVENANVKMVLTPTSTPAGDTWAVGEKATYNVTLKNKTSIARGFRIKTTNFEYILNNNNTADACKWQSLAANTEKSCTGKLTHTITEADVAAGGFTPVLVYNMYAGAGYNGAAQIAAGVNTPAESDITLLNPKENDAPWLLGERMNFSIQITNNTGVQRAFEKYDTNLSGEVDKCKSQSIENGASMNCDNREIYHIVTEEDLAAGSFTPSFTWKMYSTTGYNGTTENFAPTVGITLKVVSDLKLVSFEQSVASQKAEYSVGDELVFTITVQNTGTESLNIAPAANGSNVAFAQDCTKEALAADATHSCEVRYVVKNSDLEQGNADIVAILSGKDAAGAEIGRAKGNVTVTPITGNFAAAEGFAAYDADPAASANLSAMQMIAQDDGANVMRIPAIAVAGNGDILAAYDARPKGGTIGKAAGRAGGDSPNENSIMQRRSTDGGKTWLPATAIAAGKIGSHGYSDPSYVVDHQTGTIFNFHVYSQKAGLFMGATTQYALDNGKIDETNENTINLALSISKDNGYTWEDRVITSEVLAPLVADGYDLVGCFATSGAGTQKQTVPHAGRLLQQAACVVDTVDNGKTDNNQDNVVALTIYSDDHGETWHAGTPTDPYGIADKRMRFDENKVVELGDGTLMLNSRTATWDGAGYRLVAISKDGGETWGDYRIDQTLIDPGNNAQIIRAFPNADAGTLRSKVVLFSNTANAKNRSNGTISLSCDNGATWAARKQFRAGGTGYTTMAVQQDGSIGLLMEPNDGGWSDIAYQNFTLSWVMPNLCSELRAGEALTTLDLTANEAIEPFFPEFENNDPLLEDTVTVTGLPAGLSYNETSGKIEGTPVVQIGEATSYPVTVTLTEESDGTNYERKVTQTFTIKVLPTGGRTWYVDADNGDDDANDGLSPENPFQTLAPVNKLELLPGDAIYLKRGSVFNDQYLHLKGSGNAKAPIILSSYGDASDPLPIINTNGEGVWYQDYNTQLDSSSHKYRGDVSSSILLKDVEYIEVSELEITNKRQADQPEILRNMNAMDRTGVAVIAENIGTVNHVVLKNLYIHDVDGNVYNKHMANGGIYVIAHLPKDEKATGVARFDDVQVLDNRVEDVTRWGIGVGYTGYTQKFTSVEIPDSIAQQYGQTNVVLRGNYVKGAGGDAITVFYALRPLVEYNVSVDGSKYINFDDYPDTNSGRVAAGIWPWKTKDAVFQYNEAYNTLNGAHGNGDGMPWDSDWSDGTLYQYNYSARNTGGTYMICGTGAVNSTFRYNISQNDVGGLLDPVDGNPNGHIYNNTFYIAQDVPILKTLHTNRGKATIENNIFYYTGDTPRTEDWNRHDSGKFVKTYKNNLYYNYANKPASDTEAIQVTKGTQIFAGEVDGTMQLAPETARTDYLTYRLPDDSGAATASASDLAATARMMMRAPVSTNTNDPFGGYRLVAGSPAVDSGNTIADENGFAPEADFFGTELRGATDVGAVQYLQDVEKFSTIYLITKDAAGDLTLHVPQTDKNPTLVSQVLANVTLLDNASEKSVVDSNGDVVAQETQIAAGMSLQIAMEDGTVVLIPIQITNEYSWVENYVNKQQGNVWFGQRQASAGDEWENIATYDSKYPNWQVDQYYGPGVTGNMDLPPVGERDGIHGLLSDSPVNPKDSTAMAFRAPKTGYVTFAVKDNEPQLRLANNTGGTVTLSLYKNGEKLQSVTLQNSNTVAQDWQDYLADNPILVEQGDYLRVVAHDEGNPTQPSLWISPVITYINKALLIVVTPVEPVWDDVAGSFTVPEVAGLVYLFDGVELESGEIVDGLAGKSVTITVKPAEGYVLAEDTDSEFVHEFPQPEPELVEVGAVSPTTSDPASCTVKPFVMIADTEGVQYLVDGKEVAAGKFEYDYGQTIKVTAIAKDGYVLTDSDWSAEFTSPTWDSLECDKPEPPSESEQNSPDELDPKPELPIIDNPVGSGASVGSDTSAGSGSDTSAKPSDSNTSTDSKANGAADSGAATGSPQPSAHSVANTGAGNVWTVLAVAVVLVIAGVGLVRFRKRAN